MKIFKRVYYTIMAALLVLMMTLSIVDAQVGSYNKRFDEGFYTNVNNHIEKLSGDGRNIYTGTTNSREYIVSCFDSSFFIKDDLDTTDELFISKPETDTVKPVGVVQDTTLSQSTQLKNKAYDSNHVFVNKKIRNIVIYIPGQDSVAGKSADAILFTAHYDSVQEGAMANASSVAIMIENIKYILNPANNIKYKNDLVFVFTDGAEEGNLGAYAFYYQFDGFNDVASRIKMGSDFDMLGSSGSLLMFRTTSNNSNIVSTYSSINNGTLTSSAFDFVFSNMEKTSQAEVFTDIPSLSFAAIGGNTLNSSADNFSNINESLIYQSADMMFKVHDFYGGYDLKSLDSNTDSVFFTYLDAFTVSFPAFVSYILSGVLILMFIAVFMINARKKAFGVLSAIVGAVVQLLAILGSVAALLIAYMLVGLLLSGFGVITVRSIFSLSYLNPGIMIFVFAFACLAMVAFYIVLKKAFNVKASDVVRGNILLTALIAILIGFILPSFSYLLIFLSIMQAVVMLVYIFTKDKFKEKYKMDMERLFLYVWPVLITLPLIIPALMVFGTMAVSIAFPALAAVFMLLAGSIMPYADYLKPVMDRLASKLPKRTIRYEETVTEKVEDKAKKGKFKEVTSVKVLKKKIDRVYKHYVGVTIVAVILITALTLFSAFGFNFNSNIDNTNKLENLPYDNSIVYVYDKDGSSISKTVQIKDLNAYNYFSRYVSGYKWDSKYDAYVKTYNNALLDSRVDSMTPVKTDNTYRFTVYDITRGKVTLNLGGLKNVTKFTFSSGTQEVSYTNDSRQDTFTFELPFGWNNFTMKIEGSTSGISIDYTETIIGNKTSDEIKDIITIKEKFVTDGLESYEDYVSSAIVIKYKTSL